jgi:hypothetical protein
MARRRNESEGGKEELVQELYRDLARKYQIHRPKVEEIWSSLNASQRARTFKAGAAEGRVLKNPTDRSMGNVYKVIPEINLRDIAESGSDYLLHLLRHRATKSLIEQYGEGINGAPGDHQFIVNSMRDNNLRHANQFKYCFTTFFDEDNYGKSYKTPDASKFAQVMAGLSTAVDAGLCVPQSTGELILERQLYTLQTLNILIDDILDSSSTRNTKKLPKKSEEAARAALSNLTIVAKPDKLSLQDLEANALDQKSSLNEHLNLCCTEPVFLAHAINIWFFSRPELLQDEKGRHLPLHTDRFISISFFEVIHNAVAGLANWDYLCRLLQLLHDDGSDNQGRRSIILQEMSNVCHLEYNRAQSLFKRHVQTSSGSKYFKRISGVYDNGTPRVSMKVKPETFTRDNPQLHYMLRLCQAETDASKAVDWIKKLDDLHQAHPSERDEMTERELDCFSDLAVIASFVRSLSVSLSLPSPKLKKGQIYGSRSNDLAVEFNSLKTEIDLSAFAIPIDNLLEPGMARGALNALDQFIIEKTGTKMGFLYQDLVESCILEVLDYYEQKKAKIDELAKVKTSSSLIETPTPEVRIEQRRQKDKTRPAHSSVYDMVVPETTTQPEVTDPAQVFKVKQATFEVFSTLFSKSQSRGSITWTAFEAAMADLKFSVMPKTGSVFTFLPPKDMEVEKSITLHRPHYSRIEGYKLLMFAARLHRVYGWGEQSFKVE